MVVNRKNNLRCYAIFADVCPVGKIGEGSIALAAPLKIPGNPKTGGPAADLVYILLKNAGKGTVLSKDQIQTIGKSKLTEEAIAQMLAD